MEADRQLDQPLVKRVPPPVVGQLVEDRVAEILLRYRRCGQDNPGPEESQQQGRGRQGILIQLHGPFYSQFLSGSGQQIQLGGVGDLPAARPEAAEEILIAGELPYQQDQRPAQPSHNQDALPIR